MSNIKDLLSIGVDGTGTANSVMKWLDTNTATDSIIYDNGTNIGIGTSSPASAGSGRSVLHLNGISGTGITFSKTGQANSYIYTAETDHEALAYYVDGEHLFYTTGSERMRISAGGNVGIGTSSPAAKFQVNGSDTFFVKFQGLSQSLNLYQDVGGLGFYTSTSGTFGSGLYFGETNQTQQFYTNSTERMRITSAGNIGIGTTVPGAKLTITGGIQLYTDPYGSTPDQAGIPQSGETRYYVFNTSTSFQNFLTVPGTNATFLMVYRIGQSDLTSVPNGMVMIYSAPGVGYSVISGSSSYLNVSGSTMQIRSNWGSYGTGVWMMLTRIA